MKNKSAFGQYSGSCINCFQGTDTALAFVGCLEWQAAGLMMLGLPDEHAFATVNSFGDESKPFIVRVCAECVEKSAAPFPAPALAIPDYPVPNIQQPDWTPASAA